MFPTEPIIIPMAGLMLIALAFGKAKKKPQA